MTTKGQYKMMLACVACIMVLIVGGTVAYTYFGFRIIPTTTDTTTHTTPQAGDFFVDKAISGNTENGLPSGVPKDGDNPAFPYKISASLKFTEGDALGRGSVSGSGTITLYDYVSEELLKSYTFSSGTVTTADKYTSGQHLKFKVVESGYVTYYGAFTVPWDADNDPATIDLTVFVMDLPASYAQSCFFTNNTEVADAGNIDASASATGGLIDLRFDNQLTVDEDGYWGSYNFLNDVWQNAYYVLHITGTGTDSVLVSSSDNAYERIVVVASSDIWIVWKLTDNDLSRHVLSDGLTRDPNGRVTEGITFDVSGVTSGDSVTITYGVYWYADAGYFRSNSQWAPSNGQGTAVDTCVIIP